MRHIPVTQFKWQPAGLSCTAASGNSSSDRRSLLTVREQKQITASLEAADWFVRFQDDPMSRYDQMRYFSWLKQSPVHVAETLRLMRISRLVRSILLLPSNAKEEGVPPGGLGECKHTGPDRLH